MKITKEHPTPHPRPLPQETVSQYEKTDFFEKGGGGQVEKI